MTTSEDQHAAGQERKVARKDTSPPSVVPAEGVTISGEGDGSMATAKVRVPGGGGGGGSMASHRYPRCPQCVNCCQRRVDDETRLENNIPVVLLFCPLQESSWLTKILVTDVLGNDAGPRA